MKAILISIHSQWVELILNFIKKDEIRKGTALYKAINRLIEEQGVAPMLIYCTKGKEKLWRHDNLQTFGKLPKNVEKQFCAYGKTARELDDKLLDFLYENGIEESISRGVNGTLLNGKVIARFNATAEEIVTVNRLDTGEVILYRGHKDGLTNRELMEGSCLTFKEMNDYLHGKKGTAIHITNLKVFDKPKEIGEFMKTLDNFNGLDCFRCSKHRNCSFNRDKKCEKLKLTRAPQSWQYVEVTL